MDRWLLNTLPTWSLALIVVGGAMCVGIGGFLLMRRLVPSLGAHAESRSLSSAFGMTTGLFSFVLAFTIGQLYSNYTQANSHVKQEATQLAQVLRTSAGLPPPLAHVVRTEALAYATEVRTTEWRSLTHGKPDVHAWQRLDRIYKTLQSSRASAGSNPFFGQTLSGLDSLVAARQTRIDDANIALPDVFQVMLVLGAILALSTTFYFKPFGERLQIGMIGAASALVGTAMLVALMLDFPYSGGVTVSHAPFASQTLLLLAGG